MIYKHAQNHPKVDHTNHPISDGLQACSESSKSGSNKSSKFGRCIIIQKWTIQIIQFRMIDKHARNHPKVDHTNHPISDDLKACSESSKSGSYKSSIFGLFISMLRIIQKWIIQIIQFRMISSTFQFYIGTTDIYHPNLDDISHN